MKFYVLDVRTYMQASKLIGFYHRRFLDIEFQLMRQVVNLLKPFNETSIELGAEQNVSASKVYFPCRGTQKNTFKLDRHCYCGSNVGQHKTPVSKI